MGACGSTDGGGGGTQPTMEEVSRSKGIDKLLREDAQRQAKEVKMLLLVMLICFSYRTGELGQVDHSKTNEGTMPLLQIASALLSLSPFKVIHLQGFTPSETESYRQQVFVNVRDGMRACLYLMDELALDFVDISLAPLRSAVEAPDLREREPFPAPLLAPLKAMWKDTGLQAAVARASEATMPENIPYFYSELDRLFAPTYVPSHQDILRCRQKTTGITETVFETRHLQYRLFDVGGQRSERKKWIHCFESVTAILFLAAISSYDQQLIEDRDSNQMQEALMLFDSICNSQWFTQTSMILFLNKVDVFKERILLSPIKAHFPDYLGDDTDYNMAKEFFKERFVKLNRSPSEEIYCHFTTAIDTSLVKVVMTSVYDIILNRNLNDFIL
ncbi:hypothetical protein JCM11251_006121 [Rhodosporidiobolus azoricus]